MPRTVGSQRPESPPVTAHTTADRRNARTDARIPAPPGQPQYSTRLFNVPPGVPSGPPNSTRELKSPPGPISTDP
jgi:hypothetical protein